MIDANSFLGAMADRGIRYFTGVPCSMLRSMYDAIDRRPDLRYITASSEGDALAIASGLWLGGNMAAVLCQNSGLGNMVNPLASLTSPFRIPVLLIVTLRGLPGTHDEPQHTVMGRITT